MPHKPPPQRKPQPPRVHVSVELCPENCSQLEAIAETYHLSKTSVIAQAIAKWYHSDQAIPKKEATNGADHS